jgi:hypothetical protein
MVDRVVSLIEIGRSNAFNDFANCIVLCNKAKKEVFQPNNTDPKINVKSEPTNFQNLKATFFTPFHKIQSLTSFSFHPIPIHPFFFPITHVGHSLDLNLYTIIQN